MGWATTYYQFGYQVASMNGWNAKTDTTKQFSPRWTYNLLNAGYDSGCYTIDAYPLLSQHGAVRYSEFTPSGEDYEYEHVEWYTDTEDMRNALGYRVSSYQKYAFSEDAVSTPISSYNDSNLDYMKTLLNDGHVLVITTDSRVWVLDRLPEDSSHAGEHVCIRHEDRDHGRTGHAMAVVGYDDNIQYDLNGDGNIQDYEKGAFKVANSLGDKYLNNGFVWVMYDALNKSSNTEVQDVGIRNEIFEDYSYYVMTVDEYPLDLVAEVTLTMTQRNQTNLKLRSSSWSEINPVNSSNTLFSGFGGMLNFSGAGVTPQVATFPFDFGNVVEHPATWKNYYIEVNDDDINDSTTVIDKIDIIDSSGKYVISDDEQKIIDGTTSFFRYKIGMMGDVDNDGTISTFDASVIQQHIANNILLTGNALKLADVDADGCVDTFDVSCIQRVLAQIDDYFVSGVYAELD